MESWFKMSLQTEEDVKIKKVLPYLKTLGFNEDLMDFEKSIVVQQGRKIKHIYADIIVYLEKSKKTPVILVETKAPNEVIGRSVKEQAISYARLLDKIAPYVLISNGSEFSFYHSISKEMLSDIPYKKNIKNDLVTTTIGASLVESLQKEAKHELFIIDDVFTFKKVLKSCHNIIRNNEGYDPVQAFDELTKILFCKMFEEMTNSQNNRFTLAIYDETMKSLKMNVVESIFKETVSNPRYSGLFNSDEQIKLQNRTIRSIVEEFEGYDLSLTAFDVKGEAFEYFLSDTFTGGLGEFFTPRNVVEFIVDAINPRIGEKVVDPFCGTGGFLIYAFEVISEKIRLQDFSDDQRETWQTQLSEESLYGTDWKERTVQACKMNMIVHGDGHSGIFLHHGLKNVENEIHEDKFNICLTNPPFGSFETDKNVLGLYDLGKGRESQTREILALERSIRLVKPGGKIGIVMIHGILGNHRAAAIREYIMKRCEIEGIVTLNEDTFKGYNAGVRTSILFLKKKEVEDTGKQKPMFMAICKNTGYSPTGQEIPGNELPEILLKFKDFQKNNSTLPSNERTGFVLNEIELGERLDPPFYWEEEAITDKGKKEVSLKESSIRLEDIVDKINKTKIDLKVALERNLSDVESLSYRTIKLSELLTEIKRPVKLEDDKSYNQLGVKWYAKGAFLRETKLGKEIKANRLFQVKKGDLIYNRLFGFKGTFARISEEHDNCFVSGEFPIFNIGEVELDKELLAKYLLYYFSNPSFWNKVERISTGSTTTSRLRLNQKMFLGMKVSIPKNTNELRKIVSRLDSYNEATQKLQKYTSEVQNVISESYEDILNINLD
ncbi:N-6 DNA methylase [Shouchella sp. JSM 1781072]|uniref:N-6 DNA methylase n=1 Tax=Shouchella sp. JSM 1781072 TaxID=3344581 RepID=UPI0035C14CAD